MVLSYADLPKFFVIDWMHGVLLGVTKALMTLWLNSKYKDKDFFIGNKVTFIYSVEDGRPHSTSLLCDFCYYVLMSVFEWLL